ncbi:hypothetical protein HPB48_017535 [Haemaphysalis longicornis]|uniref:Ig-like domain-containing protein n=1 Tax=Haemaphysalis longicornis TaxID=44386 RepID=A0A9J6GDF9_HAELO|nr:hypothetical protein HPB48_017535 [Haemaphysalis longicornis]
MMRDLCADWLSEFDRDMQRRGRRVLLGMDNCSAHHVQTPLTAVTLLFLPPNTTSRVEPLDLGIIRAFRVSYTRRVVERLVIAVDRRADNLPLRGSLHSAVEMVKAAWSRVTATCVRNCFRKAGFVNTQPEAEADASDEPHSQLPPRMAEYRSQVQVEQGDRVVLPCLAQGHPPPRNHWFRLTGVGHTQDAKAGAAGQSSSRSRGSESAVPVKMSDRVSLLPGGALLLHTARTQDGGRYLCVANNSAGEDRAHTDLLITVPLSARIDPAVQVVDVGRSANLSCRVGGHPINGVIWTHNGRPISTSPLSMTPSTAPGRSGKTSSPSGDRSSSPRMSLLTRDLLHISAVEREDRGSYQCLAYNEKDSAQGSAQLVIGEDAPVLEQGISGAPSSTGQQRVAQVFRIRKSSATGHVVFGRRTRPRTLPRPHWRLR